MEGNDNTDIPMGGEELNCMGETASHLEGRVHLEKKRCPVSAWLSCKEIIGAGCIYSFTLCFYALILLFRSVGNAKQYSKDFVSKV